MSFETLSNTLDALLQHGKGILAADESTGTIAKRFASIGVDNTEENRRNYRLLLASTDNLNEYISGVILYEETFTHKDGNGTPIPDLFAKQGIVPGIKVDKGLVNLPFTNEKVTQGLDGLMEKLEHFKSLGAKFAKWRAVYSISQNTPSLAAIKANAEGLARYAACCQAVGIVPIVEPEILIDGNHSIQTAAVTHEIVLHELFHTLYMHEVSFEHMLLKPSMVTSGKAFAPFSSPEEIAEYTISVFRSHVPAAVPSINFLSGGQTSMEATVNLNAINLYGKHEPWMLSFSYGRALQDDCLKIWGQKNIEGAKEALLKRAHLNSLACLGEYNPEMEKE